MLSHVMPRIRIGETAGILQNVLDVCAIDAWRPKRSARRRIDRAALTGHRRDPGCR